MRRVRGPLGTGPCSSPGLGPTCKTMVSFQPGSIVTVSVSESVWGRYDRIFGFGATPPRQHGSLSERACGPLVPLCVAPHVCAIAPGSRPVGCPTDVGPPFLARVFRVCMQSMTGPVLCSSCHVLQHTTPESSRTPGPPAGPGWIFSHRSSVFPSFGGSFGAPHPGTVSLPPPTLGTSPYLCPQSQLPVIPPPPLP